MKFTETQWRTFAMLAFVPLDLIIWSLVRWT